MMPTVYLAMMAIFKFQRCDHCFEEFPPTGSKLPPPVPCDHCGAVNYCNERCKKDAVRDHAAECKYIKEIVSHTRERLNRLVQCPGQELIIQRTVTGFSSLVNRSLGG